MSNQNSLGTTAIILAVIGLIVGAAGGYFIANNSAQSQISGLNDEILDLTTSVTGLETQINENEVDIESLENEVADLETEVIAKDATINGLENEIASNEDIITSLEEQIESLTAITEVKEGYVQYSIYGFSFEYPSDMITSLGGVLESSATQNSGVFSASRDNGETYTVTWVHSMIALDVEGAIEGGYDAVSDFVTSRSGYKTLAHIGHTVTYEEFTLEDVTGTYTMIMGVFYCPESDKFFNINYIDQTQNTVEMWQEFLESFICHIE